MTQSSRLWPSRASLVAVQIDTLTLQGKANKNNRAKCEVLHRYIATIDKYHRTPMGASRSSVKGCDNTKTHVSQSHAYHPHFTLYAMGQNRRSISRSTVILTPCRPGAFGKSASSSGESKGLWSFSGIARMSFFPSVPSQPRSDF